MGVESGRNTESNRIKSSTLRAIGPTLSSRGAIGMMPLDELRPVLGRRPAMPHRAAGTRIEHVVSSPTASGVMRALTATAEPPLLPPGLRDGSYGLRQAPKAVLLLVTPSPSSCIFVLPSRMAPSDIEPLQDGGVRRGAKMAQRRRTRGRRQVDRIDAVFQRNRYAVQCAEVRSPRPRAVGAARRFEHRIRLNRDKRIQGSRGGTTGQQRRGIRLGADLASPHRAHGSRRAERTQIRHRPMIRHFPNGSRAAQAAICVTLLRIRSAH